MIVPMKKVAVVVSAASAGDALVELRKLGTLHLQHSVEPSGEELSNIQERLATVERAILLIKNSSKPDTNNVANKDIPEVKGIIVAEEISDFFDEFRRIEKELADLEDELERAEVWGDFDGDDLNLLDEAGISLKLFKCSEKSLKKIPESVEINVIKKEGELCFAAAFFRDEWCGADVDELVIPKRSLSKIKSFVAEKSKKMSALNSQIPTFMERLGLLEKAKRAFLEKLKFEEARAGMGLEGGVSFMQGFMPAIEVESLKKAAAKNSWAILVEEPSADDQVPTLLKHSFIGKTFRPVMEFIGVVPGYKEYDTNVISLIFFSLFFAMIVSDGGYGLLLMIAALIAGRFNISKELNSLLYILSTTTIIWGAVTGTWFGSGIIAGLPVLNDLIIPEVSGFGIDSDYFVMKLCFLIAAVHLSLAHIWQAIRFRKSLRLIGEIGWATFLWGVYFTARYLTFNEVMEPTGIYLLAVGFIMIVLFSMQEEDGILRGMLRGVAKLPVTFLDGIGSLSNIISYIRLFAVGLATREVAMAFNLMAEEIAFSGISSLFLGFMILILGHTMNMLLALMSVVVHGIRLNVLEFSGQMKIEWSGINYEPFMKKNE